MSQFKVGTTRHSVGLSFVVVTFVLVGCVNFLPLTGAYNIYSFDEDEGEADDFGPHINNVHDNFNSGFNSVEEWEYKQHEPGEGPGPDRYYGASKFVRVYNPNILYAIGHGSPTSLGRMHPTDLDWMTPDASSGPGTENSDGTFPGTVVFLNGCRTFDLTNTEFWPLWFINHGAWWYQGWSQSVLQSEAENFGKQWSENIANGYTILEANEDAIDHSRTWNPWDNAKRIWAGELTLTSIHKMHSPLWLQDSTPKSTSHEVITSQGSTWSEPTSYSGSLPGDISGQKSLVSNYVFLHNKYHWSWKEQFPVSGTEHTWEIFQDSSNGLGNMDTDSYCSFNGNYGMFMWSPKDASRAYAFARTPITDPLVTGVDFDRPYLISTNFKVATPGNPPQTDHHWFSVFSNGHVRLIIDHNSDLKAYHPGNTIGDYTLIDDLDYSTWYKIIARVDPIEGRYQVEVIKESNYEMVALNNIPFNNPNVNQYLKIGDSESYFQDKNDNYGAACYDNLYMGPLVADFEITLESWRGGLLIESATHHYTTYCEVFPMSGGACWDNLDDAPSTPLEDDIGYQSIVWDWHSSINAGQIDELRYTVKLTYGQVTVQQAEITRIIYQ